VVSIKGGVMNKTRETDAQKYKRLDRKWFMGKATRAEMLWCTNYMHKSNKQKDGVK
jgi:hypothetical protein